MIDPDFTLTTILVQRLEKDSQKWSQFIAAFRDVIQKQANQIFFDGPKEIGLNGFTCFVVWIPNERLSDYLRDMGAIVAHWNQAEPNVIQGTSFCSPKVMEKLFRDIYRRNN